MTDVDAQNKEIFQLKLSKDTTTKKKNGTKARKNTSRKEKSEKSTGGILQMRRFVKATPPPPSDHSIDVQTDPESTDQDSSPEREREMPVISVQDETLREKTAEWRQKRLDASAAIRKEHKEKEILEHRLNHPSERTGTAAPETLDVDKENIPIPAALSVSPQFPEHKRKATDDEYEEVGKKPRATAGERGIDENTIADADADFEVANERMWQTRATAIMKASAPGVAVAIVAILAVQFFRKR